MTERKNGYYLVDSKQLPSVTTILKSAGNAGGLINWGSKQGGRGVIWGLRGIDNADELLKRLANPTAIEWADEQSRAGLEAESKRVQDFGTHVHTAIEHHLKQDAVDSTLTKEEKECLDTFIDFQKHVQFPVVDTEFECINKEERYAGRADFLTELTEEMCVKLKPFLKRNSDVPVPGKIIADFKTGAMYPKSMSAQLAAYDKATGSVASGALIISIERNERDKVKCFFFNRESLDEAYAGFKHAYGTWLFFDSPKWFRAQWK